MNRLEQLALEAEVSACILGNLTTRDFALVDLHAPGPIPECLHGRGLGVIGVTGIVGGVPRTALAVELDDVALSAIAQVWLRYLSARITPHIQPPPGDSIRFLERLHALDDTRQG
jgi:hypothetical protein